MRRVNGRMQWMPEQGHDRLVRQLTEKLLAAAIAEHNLKVGHIAEVRYEAVARRAAESILKDFRVTRRTL